jgi:hypothetical protein
MVVEETRIKVVLLVHDEANENPLVEVNLQILEKDTALESLIATYSEDSE